MNWPLCQKLIFLFTCCFPLALRGQNLIPNPSFEEGPAACGFTRLPELFHLPPWSLPTAGTTDIFSTKLPNAICWAHAPKSTTTNNFSPAIGHQFPRSGDRFVGIISMELTQPEFNYREYLQVKMNTPLEVGHSYCAEMFVSLAEQPRYASNNLGFLFTSELISQQAASFSIERKPQVYESRVITDSIAWTRIAGMFTADSNYQYLTIGTFLTYGDTKILDKGGTAPDSWSYETAYYFVDDVSVSKAEGQKFAGDTVICPGTTANVEALIKWDSIYWTTLTHPSLKLSETAKLVASPLSTSQYLVKGKICNTWTSDTLTIRVKPSKEVSLGTDVVLCHGETMILRADPAFKGYEWSDGSSGPSLSVSETGVYKLTGRNENGCESSDEIRVSFVDTPFVNLGPDTVTCEFFLLNGKGSNSGSLDFVWSTGAKDSIFLPQQEGKYWVTVRNECGYHSDTIVVSSFDDIFVPNVVTPNDDGINERLQVVAVATKVSPSLKVYNSWGLEIYTNDKYDSSWPDNEVLPGIYFFTINQNNCRSRKGWIQVLK
jgi:hypothetical protein